MHARFSLRRAMHFALLMIGAGSLTSIAGAPARAQEAPKPETLPLWSGEAPIGDGRMEQAKSTITVYRPAPDKANGAAMVICPGGGYGGVVHGPEGHGIAQWLNQHGITGIVLVYRLPAGRSHVPLLDAQHALRTARAKAEDWKIDPKRIGIIGFSAGGHLASTAGTHFDAGNPQAADPIDRACCRPDFMVLVYPVITMGEKTHGGSRNNLLGKAPTSDLLELFSNEKQVNKDTPPAFLAHAKNDTVVIPEHSEMFRDALKANNVPVEYLELASGGHGLNGYKGPMWDEWQNRSLAWLAAQKIIPNSDVAAAPLGPAFNRARFFPAAGLEQSMVGGKFTGSNRSPSEGFVTLGEIKAAPATGTWTELSFPNEKTYRWLRYEAPAGSHGAVAELEFFAGSRKLTGFLYGSPGERQGRFWRRAVDGDEKTWFDSSSADGQYVGLDLLDVATPRAPAMTPGAGEFKDAVDVKLTSETPGAAIRYTLDGTEPAPSGGLLFSAPLHIDKPTTIVAVSVKEDMAPSRPVSGTYLPRSAAKPGFNTLHVGNSLTNTTGRFAMYARAAGYLHEYRSVTMGGALTKKLWDEQVTPQTDGWKKALSSFSRIDHFTVQPRDFDIDREADYDIRFFNVIRAQSPEFQPWLYIEWVEQARQRPTDKGLVRSSQMKKLWPAATWEESMSAMLLYGEELQKKIGETYKEGKRPRIIPSCLAMGWIRNMIDRGEVPGAEPGSFYPLLFSDSVHPNFNGAYLVDATWFAALYRESPAGKMLPIGTQLTVKQADIFEKLAWDVVKNYPDCGQYEDGREPVGKPEFATAGPANGDITPTRITSSTPGAWFRYTLDGTTPTRTTGYVYCGVASLRPGMTLKAVAYKSGMADSGVSEGPAVAEKSTK